MRIHDIADAPLEAVITAAEGWVTSGSELGTTAGGLDAISDFPGWSGTAAEGMAHRVSASAGRVDALGSAARATGTLLNLHYHAVHTVQATVAMVMGVARYAGMTVHGDGTVTAGGAGYLGVGMAVLDHLPAVGGAVDAAEIALTTTLKTAMTVVRTLDGTVAQLITAVTAVDHSPAPIDVRSGVAGPSPADIAVNASLDISAAVHIEEELESRLSPDALAELRGYAAGAARELQLRGLNPVEIGVQVATVSGSPAVVVGNIPTADKVTTLVSGTGSSATSGLRDSAALAGRITGAGQATIAWHGYPAPNTLRSATSPLWAKVGAPALHGLQGSLRARNPDARLSIVGHSYGTQVIDAAGGASTPLEVDEIHLMGSPGMRAGSVSALNLHALDGATDVHVHESVGDPINIVAAIPGFLGSDPSSPAFGADSVNGRSPNEDGGVLGRWWDTLSEMNAVANQNTDAHSTYRGDEKVLEALRR